MEWSSVADYVAIILTIAVFVIVNPRRIRLLLTPIGRGAVNRRGNEAARRDIASEARFVRRAFFGVVVGGVAGICDLLLPLHYEFIDAMIFSAGIGVFGAIFFNAGRSLDEITFALAKRGFVGLVLAVISVLALGFLIGIGLLWENLSQATGLIFGHLLSSLYHVAIFPLVGMVATVYLTETTFPPPYQGRFLLAADGN